MPTDTGDIDLLQTTLGIDTVTTAAASAFTFQIGANQSQQFTASISDMRSAALGIAGTAGTTTAVYWSFIM